MKKFIAILLTLCMLLPALPAFAASDAAGLEYSKDSISGEIVFDAPETEGKWSQSNYGGLDHVWSNEKGAEATYKIEGIKASNYELYYWLIPHNFDSKEITLNIDHNGKTSEAKLPSKLESGEESVSGWVSLGVYDFKGEGDEKVYSVCQGANIRATKIRLVKTDKEVTAVAAPQKTEDKKEENAEAGNAGTSLEAKPSGVCEWVGDWAFSTATPGPLKSNPEHMWIAGCGEEAFVTYKPMIEAVGDVRISIYQLYWHENQTNDIKYEVFHNGKVDEFHLNPLDIDKSQWITLGTFDFAGKSEEEYLKLSCVKNENAKANTRASTVMFEILNERGGTAWQAIYVQPCRDAEKELANTLKQLAPLNKFSDMTDHWASYDVEYMANEGLIAGKSENAFDPDAQITRAEYLTILDRAMGYELITGETFSDVPQDSWYSTYVATAKANGLLNGLPTDDGFKPEAPITREDMALFTYNAIKATKKNDEWVKNLPTDFAKFTDASEISDYAK
ncbi:MAG: S-layer homology domain-containing protein, partial [Clostridia bacterium]|nr:S-layer homology domain-containing protein [Clostridia bacterium]